MKNIFFKYCIIFIITLSGGHFLFADDGGWGVAPIAAPYYTPDTKWAIGAYLVPYYKPAADSVFTGSDEYTFYICYTQLKQVAFGFLPEAYFSDGRIKISGRIEACRYPTLFWGIGPDTSPDAEEKYTESGWWGDLAFLFGTGHGFYIGPLYHYRNTTVGDYEAGGILDSGSVTGTGHYHESGPGFAFQLDTRDSIFFPRRGFYMTHKSSFQHSVFGSDNNFGRHESDFRIFFGITGEHVLAFQLMAKISHGDVPLRSLSGIGGDKIMRGYLENRFLDKTSLAAQVEYRFPIVWRFAGVVNASVGEVQDSLNDYNAGDIHAAAGAGLRVILDRTEHIAGRIDLGWDEHGALSVYVLVKEAF